MALGPNTSHNNNILSSLVCIALRLYSSNQDLIHAYVANNSPGSNNVVGKLSSAIFKRGLLDDDSSPFDLLVISGVRRGIEPDYNTWNTPDHLSNFNSYLSSTMEHSHCCDTYCGNNVREYYNFGGLAAGGAMTTTAPFSFHKKWFLLFCIDVLPCGAFLHFAS